MDIFELLALQQKNKRQEHMAKQREQIRALRAEEEVASQQRMATLEADAATYEAEIRRRQALRRAEEKRMLMLALGAVTVFLLIVVAYTVATLL